MRIHLKLTSLAMLIALTWSCNNECGSKPEGPAAVDKMDSLASQEITETRVTPELLWKVLTEKRWELLKALCGAGPMSIREAARRIDRDVKAVHGDVTALLNAGVLDRTEDGQIEFPFDAVKVEFLLQAA